MSLEIAVLYGAKDAELTGVVRVPFADKLLLPRTGVVAMSIIDSLTPIKTNRYQQSIFHDIYHLIWTDTDCFLGGHDIDFLFCPLTESWKNLTWRFPYILPTNCIEFEGIYVSPEAWRQAKVIYGDSRGEMF